MFVCLWHEDSHLTLQRLALLAEAADGAGLIQVAASVDGLGQSRDPAEQSRSFGLQLERQVVEDAQAVFYGLFLTGRQQQSIWHQFHYCHFFYI